MIAVAGMPAVLRVAAVLCVATVFSACIVSGMARDCGVGLRRSDVAAVVFVIGHGWFFPSVMVKSCRRQCSKSWCGNPSASR